MAVQLIISSMYLAVCIDNSNDANNENDNDDGQFMPAYDVWQYTISEL